MRHGHPLQQKHIAALLLAAVMACALVTALNRAWLCDDAFISFRYARNLVEGFGLVFNEGERVEGFTNFLWTLWCAAGLRVGVPCEYWAIAWGILFYTLSVGLLGLHFLRLRGVIATGVFPLAALMAALHQDWSIYATSGLETSAFTFWVLLAYTLLAEGAARDRPRPGASGVVLALACLTRPDGVIFAAIGASFLLWTAPRRGSAALRFVASFAAVFGPPLAWRVWYYGDCFPNAYYAKSAALAWWPQGWHYLCLYFKKYAFLLFGPAAVGLSLLHRSSAAGDGMSLSQNLLWHRPLACESTPARRRCHSFGLGTTTQRTLNRLTVLALAFAGCYTLYVTRVGGDFMFARLLIPATPFYLILLELGRRRLHLPHRAIRAILPVLFIAALLVAPYVSIEYEWHEGISNEWYFYGARLHYGPDDRAETLRRYFAGLPVRVAFLGTEARLMYYARVPIAIESETGLTDRFIARQGIAQRGRIGHEKHAPVDYLIQRRKVHFMFERHSDEVLNLDAYIPIRRIRLDNVEGFILHWDADLLAELRRRGAVFDDFPADLDRVIPTLGDLGRAELAETYAKFRHFYFDHVNDPIRQRPFRERLRS